MEGRALASSTPATLSWTQPICERCWILRDESYTSDDALKMPIRLKDPELEFCSYCGLITFVGIYIRDDPANVPFPKEKAKEDK